MTVLSPQNGHVISASSSPMLPILYQDSDLVIVNKPSGLLVHRSHIDRYETRFAMQMVRDQIGQQVYTVHRLDKPTSGALVFALSSDVARTMSEGFAAGLIHKKYLAVVRGWPEGPLTVDYPLKEELDKTTDGLASIDKPPQSAVTEFEILGRVELPVTVDRFPTSRYSLIKAIPLTGRRHQIRRHLRHLGHPIIGDITYGVGKHNRFFENEFKMRRLLLACTGLEFAHPVSGRKISVKAGLSADFREVIERLGWSHD